MTHPTSCPCPWCRASSDRPSIFAQDKSCTPSKRSGKSISQSSTETVLRHERKTGLALSGMGKSKRGFE